MKQKSDISTIFFVFHKMLSTQFNSKMQTLRFDNGRKYFN